MKQDKDQRSGEERHDDAKSATIGANQQNTSASRGGTTDMDQSSIRDAAGNAERTPSGSGMHTKTSVTGSDFDGQVSE